MKSTITKIGLEPREAQAYIIDQCGINNTKTNKNKVAKFLAKYKPIIIHKRLNLLGYSKQSVESALNDFCNSIVNKGNESMEKIYDTEQVDINTFRNTQYALNRIYTKAGNPMQYTKMITYIENNGYGTPIELIAAGKEGLGITEFNQLNLDLPVDKIEAYKRFSGGLRNLIKVGILKIESGEVVKGKNYDAYYNFILKKQHDLTSAGIEIKESE